MLDLPRCTLIETYMADTVANIGVLEEGTALVHVLEGGISRVQPSTGGANEIFMGMSLGRPTLPVIVPYLETVKVPASGAPEVTLARSLNGSEIRATRVEGNTRTTLTAGNPGTTANTYSVSGNKLTFNAADAGKTFDLAYRYAITYQEAIFRYNFDGYGYDNRTSIGAIGVVSTGILYTDNYDILSDWAGFTGSTPIKLAPNGRLSLSGNGVAIDGIVMELPSNESGGFLGVRIGQKHS